MRVTQQMMNMNMLTSLTQNLSRMEKVQQQLYTGKKINKPSDDPVGLSYAMRYHSELATNEQYQRNLDSALSWLDHTDTVVGQAVDVIQRVRDLVVQGSSESNSTEALQAIASEVDELAEELRTIANNKFNGKYVFNGHNTDQAPYPTADSYQDGDFDGGKISFEVSRGVIIDVNFNAGELFGRGEDSFFSHLAGISKALNSGDAEAIQEGLKSLDSGLDNLLEKWSELGAKENRVELIDSRLKDNNLNIQTLLSKTEDADLALVITKLKMEENVYMASLSAGARIIQPSLLDFLR